MKEEYTCEHIKENEGHVYLWIGDTKRITLCRLCSTIALGTIISARMQEVFQNEYIRDVPYGKEE